MSCLLVRCEGFRCEVSRCEGSRCEDFRFKVLGMVIGRKMQRMQAQGRYRKCREEGRCVARIIKWKL